MDRQSIIGIVLIAVVIGAWVFLQSSTKTADITPKKTAQTQKVVAKAAEQAAQSAASQIPFTGTVSEERFVTVETDLLRVRLSSKGATIVNWRLKDFQPWYKEQQPNALVDLVQVGAHELGFSFRTNTGSKVQSENIPFEFIGTQSFYRISNDQKLVVTARAQTAEGGLIERRYTFFGNRYHVDTKLILDNMGTVIPQTNGFVDISWAKGIRYNERSAVDESNNAVAMASYNGEIDELDATEFNNTIERKASGNIPFLATRSKYFAVALKPAEGFDGNAFYAGTKYGAANDGTIEKYSLTYRLPYRGGKVAHDIQLFAGPMQYDTLKSYGLKEVMNFGWKLIVKPIGEYFMLPLLKLVHSGIANWGIAIIIFGVIMKLLLYPLSIGQMKNAKKMQLLAPLMNDIREKYKDDNVKQQQETMKLYSEYGINPAGGCLPLLLQMPFLYALYSVLNLNVELRQAAFLPMWLTDLSVPDVIFSLPFKLPLVGIDKFSGLALLMGATLFIQQKQAITDPRQKGMVYMMPVMFTLMFSSLPSGLNLYYFVFNILGIGQQIYQSKFSKNQLTLAQLKALPKKESWLQKKMREAQEIAASQGRSIPGAPQPPSNKNQVTQKKTGKRK